jgi:hypothetical protein
MSERRKVEERIRRKEQEIQHLEAQVREAKVYIQALQDVLKIFPKDSGGGASAAAELRAGSAVAQAREVILLESNPLHITDILQRLGRNVTKGARVSLASSLAAYVRKGEIFTRTAPNTFGLIELGHIPAERADTPPDEFGEIEESAGEGADDLLK